MKRSGLTFLFLTLALCLEAQVNTREITGTVSFLSSQNIYVRFRSTEGISSGDTLFILTDGKNNPALIVNSLSSTSCVCRQITTEKIAADQLIFARPKNIHPAEKKQEEVKKDSTILPQADTSHAKRSDQLRKQNIHGSLSVQTYSDLSNTPAANMQRYRYILSLDARNIGNSRLSAESYLSFGYTGGEWKNVKSDVFSALKIYALAFRYEAGKSSSITIGRKVNPNISNIGAIDGVQYEVLISRLRLGTVAGFRPDYTNYGLNTALFQAGAFMSYETKSAAAATQSSIAFMQQMNGSVSDRRFIYLQHSNMLGKSISMFNTCEIDLFKPDTANKPVPAFNLTSLYISLRYRITGNLSVSGSYDARKNVIYFETYKTYLDRLLETAMRQGYRLQVYYRISRSFNAGLSAGYRFASTDPHPSKNINGSLVYMTPSGSGLSITLNGSYLQTSYMNGTISGIDFSQSFFGGKLSADLGYKYVDYTIPEASSRVKQNIAEVYLGLPVSRKLFFSFNYEGTFEKSDVYNRIYFQARLRF
jgi:hypothetical protein